MTTKAQAIAHAAAIAATADRYKKLPGLPTERDLGKQLRQLNANLEDGGADVWLYCQGANWPDAAWVLGCDPCDWPRANRTEYVPGEGKPFDSAAAARRLLSEARVAGFR
jgi:hypothetical protein